MKLPQKRNIGKDEPVMQLKINAFAIACFFALTFFSCLPSAAQDSGKKNKTVAADTIPQRFIKVEKIYIIGHKRTRKSIITRELSIEENGIYDSTTLATTLELDKQKIFNTRLFNTVDVTLLETAPGIGSVLVKVEERWYFFPAPIFQLADRNFNDWWTNRGRDFSRVNYGVRVDQYNLRGMNDRLRLIAQFGFTRQFDITYSIPYFDKRQRHGFTTGASYNESKNVAYQTDNHIPTFIRSEDLIQNRFNTYLQYSYRNAFYNFHYFTVGYQKLEAADTIRQLNPNYFGINKGQQQFVHLKYQFLRDRRDFRNYPLKGYYVSFIGEKDGLSNKSDVNLWSGKLLYAKFWDMGKGFYFATGLTGLVSGPSSQPYSLNQSLGFGRNYVRGFELNVVEGPRYVLSKNTFKKEIFKTTKDISKIMLIPQFQKLPLALYAKVFFDLGYVQNYPNYELNTRLSNKLLYGVGTGLDLVSFYDFVVRTEYSYNSQGDFHFFLNFKAEL